MTKNDTFKPFCEYSNYGSFPGTTVSSKGKHIDIEGHSNCAIRDCMVDGSKWLCEYKLLEDTGNVTVDGEEVKLYETTAYMPPVNVNTTGGLIVYLIGLVYMFLGLAIVCDEFFVPALEEIVERTGMTEDVAGATLMAAGGSAPELFTSFLGTFVTKSSVGFGTIVGSAVFNVLFVIGMCAIFSKDDLTLTWWPLFRDSMYYLLSLCMVAVFFSVISPGEIYWYEALFLFCMYGLYVLIMKYNKTLHGKVAWLIGKTPPRRVGSSVVQPAESPLLVSPPSRDLASSNEVTEVKRLGAVGEEEEETKVEPAGIAAVVFAAKASRKGRISLTQSQLVTALAENRATRVAPICESSGEGHRKMMARARQKTMRMIHSQAEAPTFRAGVLNFMKTSLFAVDNLRVHVVSDLAGNIEETFKEIDKDGDGVIDKAEMKQLLQNLLKREPEEKEVLKYIQEIGPEGPQHITKSEFAVWYFDSEIRLEENMIQEFKRLDENDNDRVDMALIGTLLRRISGSEPTEKLLASALQEFDKDSDGLITLEEFRHWYKHSLLYQTQIAQSQELSAADEEEEIEGLDPWPPLDKGPAAMVVWLLTLPIVGTLYLTMNCIDVRREDRKGCYPLTWIMSIVWIAVYSYFMVWWATIIGDSAGIPPVVMGLTFLAAGTSVPDLLTSVIVARQGLGDMAVSSSIGSNIFDVLVGLPIPWLIHGLMIGPFKVGAESLGLSIALLCVMLAILVGSIHLSGWKMSKTLGYVMFVAYGLFVAQDLVRQKMIGCL